MLDIDLDEVFSARLKDPRSRELAHRDEPEDPIPIVELKPVPEPARPPLQSRTVQTPAGEAEVYEALILGTRDYVRKNGFERIVLGVSGGIDSALTASVAVDALGAENVTGVFMPSPFTTKESEEDARGLAANLGIRMLTLPIAAEMEAYRSRCNRCSKAGRGRDRGEHPARIAATSSWRSRTSSAGSCSPRGTRANTPRATRRSTATWPGASRC